MTNNVFKKELFLAFIFIVIIINMDTIPCLIAQEFKKSQSDSINQKLLQLEHQLNLKRLDQLEEQIKLLSKNHKNVWQIIGYIINHNNWLIITIILVSIFGCSVNYLVRNITKLKIGNLELSSSDVSSIIVEYEKLKMGISIAGADGKWDDKEGKYLEELVKGMSSKLDAITKEKHKDIIQQSIEVAAKHNGIDTREYKTIKGQLNRFQVTGDELNEMIIEYCALHEDVTPPPQLKKMVEDRKAELNKEIK